VRARPGIRLRVPAQRDSRDVAEQALRHVDGEPAELLVVILTRHADVEGRRAAGAVALGAGSEARRELPARAGRAVAVLGDVEAARGGDGSTVPPGQLRLRRVRAAR